MLPIQLWRIEEEYLIFYDFVENFPCLEAVWKLQTAFVMKSAFYMETSTNSVEITKYGQTIVDNNVSKGMFITIMLASQEHNDTMISKFI